MFKHTTPILEKLYFVVQPLSNTWDHFSSSFNKLSFTKKSMFCHKKNILRIFNVLENINNVCSSTFFALLLVLSKLNL
jgi:hypothetical protein